jgi:hypothetical protein
MSASSHIFVSYSRADTAAVDRIVEALRGAGYSIWIDRSSILGARLWRRELVAAIRNARAVLFALSPRSAASPSVRKEIDLSDQYGRPIIPLRIAETSIPEELEFSLAGVQLIDWYRLNNFDEGLQELRRTLDDLKIGPADGANDEASSPGPSPVLLHTAPAILGVAAVLAAIIVYAAAMFVSPGTAANAPIAPLMPATQLGIGSGAASGLGLLTLLGVLGGLFGRWKSLRPAILGLGVFLALVVSVAIWKEQYLTAALGGLTSVAVCAWWARKLRMGLTQRSAVLSALVLLTAVLVGSTAQYLRVPRASASTIIGIAPFEVVEDDELRSKQADHSNTLRGKLSAVFSRTRLSVVPNAFDPKQIDEWSFDNWRAQKAREVAPSLLLRTTLNRCGKRSAEDAQRESYIWLAEPYGRDLEHLPDFVRAVGPDTRILSLRVAFRLLTAAPLSNELSVTEQQRPRRVIVDEIRSIALAQEMTELADAARAVLTQPVIADEQIRSLFKGFESGEGICDEVAARSRGAFGANVGSYASSATPPIAPQAGL